VRGLNIPMSKSTNAIYEITQSSFEVAVGNNSKISLQVVGEGIIRVRAVNTGDFPKSALEKHGFISVLPQNTDCRISQDEDKVILCTDKMNIVVDKVTHKLTCTDSNGNLLMQSTDLFGISFRNKGHRVSLSSAEDEKYVGFGDQSRDGIEYKGKQAIMWIRNVTSYIPVPFFMSSKGYGILVNTTWKHYFDMGFTDAGMCYWDVTGGNPDYYIIYGPTFARILDRYTGLTGRPPIPPVWSFGLWFLCRDDANDKEVMSNAQNFRDKDIPCDVIGLEPGWMAKYYDFSTKREWHPERFNMPSWVARGNRTFISALKRMGYKLELWECNDYDLSYEADRMAKYISTESKDPTPAAHAESSISMREDEEAMFPLVPGTAQASTPVILDDITNPDEPWFEHHKQFIDQGADFFKQDGSNQVLEHPDRMWGNGMCDAEMHNLYPLLYSRQMYEGFKEYTNRRPLIFTPDGWAGLQRYSGTWAGDTGGGPKSLIASLNLAFTGHTYTTCDMSITSAEGIHFGFLQPWSQVNSFGTWDHPWLLGDKLTNTFRYYDHLRYSLLPYLYSYAYEAYKTGLPILRPMALEYQEDSNTYSLLNQYLLGREILVGAFTNKVYLPAGRWIDYWCGDEYEGPGNIECAYPDNRGGLLFVRAGAIIPMLEPMDYIGQRPWDRIILNIYEGEDSDFTLYEDDGISFGYEHGESAITTIRTIRKDREAFIDIAKRNGRYRDMPENRDFVINIRTAHQPERILESGMELAGTESWSYDPGRRLLSINAKDCANGKHITIKYAEE
jgi:alpha-glucosidase